MLLAIKQTKRSCALQKTQKPSKAEVRPGSRRKELKRDWLNINQDRKSDKKSKTIYRD